MVAEKRVTSPCIGVCSTGIGDSVCRGCKRYCHEIIHWNSYAEVEKLAILKRLESLLAQVVKAKVCIIDEALLKEQLNALNIRFRAQADPHCWVFDLIKAGASQITNLQSFGCMVLREFADRPITELRDAIDKDFYVLSTVHYERYFQVSISQ